MPNKSIKKSSRKSIKIKKRVNKTSRKRGGSKSKKLSPKANSAELGLERVNTVKIIPCSNKKFGCKIKPFPRFECLKHHKTNKHTTRPDSVYLLSKKGKGTQKLKKGVIKIFDGFFDCSNFEDE